MRLHLAIRSVLAVLLLSLAGPARATVIVPLALDELVARSDLVVRGVVEESESRFTSGGGQIFTFSRVRVTERFKGDALTSVEVRTPGGTVGELTQQIAGAPRLQPGEEVILLLRRVHPEHAIHVITGFSQGSFQVITDPRLGRAVVRPRGPALLEGGKVSPAPGFAPVAADAFVERLRRSAGAGSVP